MRDMAGTDAPFGLQVYGPCLHSDYYAVVTSYGTDIFIGDLVEAVGEGVITPHKGNLQKAAVEEGGAAGSLLGSVMACFDSNFDTLKYLPSSTTGNGVIAGYVLVADDPHQEFVIQEDGDTESIQVASIGLNAEAISTHGGSTKTGLSKMEIDSSSKASTLTLALKLLRAHEDDTISAAGAAGNYCRFIVTVNSHHRGSNVAGV